MTPQQRRSPRFLALARRYARRELAHSLDGLHVAGLEVARRAVSERPALLVANHVCWWDSFLVVTLDQALGTEGYALMDAENLCRIPFFARMGAIPLDRQRPRAGLRAAASLLDRPGRTVWIFPQGGHRPAHLRPLGFQPGVRMLARLAPGAVVIPVAYQYAFGEGHYPAAYASFGEALAAAEVAGDDGTQRLEAAVEQELQRIDDALAGRAPTLPALVASRGQRPDGGWGTRLLNAILGRPRHGGAHG
jgi:1-acyl-sn-glycerol-3-phosphate acyltransferase